MYFSFFTFAALLITHTCHSMNKKNQDNLSKSIQRCIDSANKCIISTEKTIETSNKTIDNINKMIENKNNQQKK